MLENRACSRVTTIGPVKPKLVAKASGVETSPWKMNKKAPRIPPSEVPEALRPLLSYTLWRLYENVATWSDSNPTVLLSSDPKTSTMARKLNITVKQIGQLRQAIASKKMVKTNRHVSGHLERDFGITISKTSPLKNGKVHTGSENSTSETREDCELNELVDSNSEPSELVVSDRELNGDHGVPGKTEDTLIDGGEKANLAVDQYEQKDFHQPAEQAIATANSDNLKELKRILHISESAPSEDQKLAASPKPAWIASEVDFPLEETEIHTKGTITTGITAEADANIVNKLSAKVENTFDKNDFAPHSARVPIVRHGNLRHENYSEFSQREITSRPATINSASLSSRPSSRESSSLPTQVTQEPEDSDEEVVVFNPRAKRFSAQHKKLPTPNVPDSPKAAGATISATTSVAVAMTTDSTAASTAPAIAPVAAPAIAPTKPPTAPTVVPMIAPTIAPVIAPAIVPATETSPKLASAKANSPTLPYVRISSYKAASGKTNPAKPNHGKHSRPQTPVVQAAIIDPDFFGRSSVVNVRPNIQNGNSRNSPRASPRRGPRIPDSDVDYVLTSGATREAARGRGKLWIP